MNDDTTTTYLCIGCPLGCRLEVDEDEAGDVIEVRGAACKRGDRYGRLEHTDPRRMLTTTGAIDHARWPRLPVKTAEPIPKDRVLEAARALAGVKVAAPVALGDVVLADVVGTGIDVVATRDMATSTPV